MKQSSIRIIIILGAITIFGIITVQIYWIRKAWDANEKELNQRIYIALQNVANNIFRYSNIDPPANNPINQLSASYFVVNTNSEINPEILEFYLISEFNIKNINLDFEYGIYNCNNDKMVYGKYISTEGHKKKIEAEGKFTKHEDFIYYFGINFPSRNKVILNSMSVWIIFSSILLIVIVFFIYSMFIILRQKRLSEQQRDFINNMTHEFKTPISSISLSADVLLNPDISTDNKRLNIYAGLIKQENQRLNEQVEKVLNLARIESSGFKLKKEKIDANQITQNILQNMLSGSNKFCLSLHLYANKSVIIADKLHFTNIIFNLTDNAIKYSPQGCKINITTTNSKDYLIFIVEDNGKGIDPREHKLVFKKFYRVSTGNVHDVKGFGLGLYYVKTICKLHGWKIRLESALGMGTKVKIIIPLLKNG